jgi:hypothetical protein
MVASNASDWAQVVVTALIGAVTVFVALSIHLKRRQEIAVVVAQKRHDAYSALWELIPYSLEKQDLKHEGSLSPACREKLFDKMTGWYYAAGHGMMLGSDTREMYLTTKKNLLCNLEEFVPKSWRDEISESEDKRSDACVRQLSLLRSAMRADFEVFGKPWGKKIEDPDRDFILGCGARPSRLMRSRRDRLRERWREVWHPPQRPADKESQVPQRGQEASEGSKSESG